MRRFRHTLSLLVILMLVCSVLFCGCGSQSSQTKNTQNHSTTTTNQKAYSPPSQAEQRINWINSLGNKAYNVMVPQYDEGTTAWIYGYAYNVHYAPDSNGQPTFIDMSERGYESRQLTAIVWGEDLGNFDMDLSSLQGKYIAVYGTVYRYQGYFKQVKLTDQSQISVCPVPAP